MTITIEAPDEVHAGEPIRGIVRGAADHVRVFVRRTTAWDERSGGAPVNRDADAIVTGSGSFVLPATRGPLSFRGEHAEVRWSIVASSVVAPNERVERPFVLIAPKTAIYEREATGGYRDRPTETTLLEPDFGEAHVEGPRRRQDVTDEPFVLFGTTVARFFTMIAGERATRDVRLDVSPSRVRAGDGVVAKLSFVASEETVVESITFQLLARESGAARRRQEHFFDSHTETVTERVRLDPGPYTYERRLTVPANAPASWSVTHYGVVIGVEWFVRATIQIDGRVDDVSDFVIGVAPF